MLKLRWKCDQSFASVSSLDAGTLRCRHPTSPSFYSTACLYIHSGSAKAALICRYGPSNNLIHRESIEPAAIDCLMR
jgi:hypothetical protein